MASRRRRVAHLESTPLTEFVTADPATHAALREAVEPTVDALTPRSAPPGPRSPLTTEQLAARRARSTRCPPEGAPIADVLDELAADLAAASGSGTRARSRTCTPRR